MWHMVIIIEEMSMENMVENDHMEMMIMIEINDGIENKYNKVISWLSYVM